MITEGIITSIDYTANKCFIRLPVFETVSSNDPVIIEGRIATQPGSYNGYVVDDTVWVSFVDNKFEQPLVIGKIYQGPDRILKETGGYLNLAGLNITGLDVSLPKETKIINSKNNISLEQMINTINDLEIKLNQKDETINELKKDIRAIYAALGDNITDAEGNLLADKNNELLQYGRKSKIWKD